MKTGWRSKRLSDITSFLNRGISPKYLDAGGICVLNQKCIRDHSINYGPARRHDSERKPVGAVRLVQAGDVLVNSTGTGTLGRVAQVRQNPIEPTTVDSHVTIVRPTPGQLIPDFFGYMLVVIEDAIKEAGEGCGGQTELARSALADKFLVHYPESLPEQRRIVGILDEAFEGIAAAKANAKWNLQNARALFESHFEDAFTKRGKGWAEQPLSNLCDIKHGFTFKSEYFTETGDHILLTPGNFFESGGFRDRGEKQKYFKGEIPDGFVLSAGDLLVAMTEQAAGLLGSPVLIPKKGKFLHNQRLGLVTGKPDVPWSNEFFFHVFNTRAVREAIHDSASGVKVRHTSPTKIGDVVVAFPTSPHEQTEIASRLRALATETQRLATLYRRKLTVLDELKKSLLHQAFFGQL